MYLRLRPTLEALIHVDEYPCSHQPGSNSTEELMLGVRAALHLPHLLQFTVLHLDGGMVLYPLPEVVVASDEGILLGKILALLGRERETILRWLVLLSHAAVYLRELGLLFLHGLQLRL